MVLNIILIPLVHMFKFSLGNFEKQKRKINSLILVVLKFVKERKMQQIS